MRPASSRGAWVGRLALAAPLVLLIFWLGYAVEPVFAALTRGWQRVLHAPLLQQWLHTAQHGTSTEVTKRSLPAGATYAVLYLAACLLLLRALLPAARWWLAVQLYAGVLALIAGLVATGKLAGDVPLLYKASRRLLDFLVSPLPVALLLALLLVPARPPE